MYTLQRITQSENGTFGSFTGPDGKLLCYTCERPPIGDHPCIPAGLYNSDIYYSPTKGQVWQLLNVPSRSNIEIHIGNTIKDTEGCILVGLDIGFIGSQPAVLKSKEAFDHLRSVLPQRFICSILGIEDL